ncbi:hypothetical protein [Polaromonas sp.]|uniref:hypothetical protein n=1 Tax=Polaromonas sp. TaxID=1869339 RepID=UPI0017CE25A2|nr:hypothetical protein [Polaromonas sp.]NMM07579.1 hypothetical protein [Polaromonas sp.]
MATKIYDFAAQTAQKRPLAMGAGLSWGTLFCARLADFAGGGQQRHDKTGICGRETTRNKNPGSRIRTGACGALILLFFQ